MLRRHRPDKGLATKQRRRVKKIDKKTKEVQPNSRKIFKIHKNVSGHSSRRATSAALSATNTANGASKADSSNLRNMRIYRRSSAAESGTYSEEDSNDDSMACPSEDSSRSKPSHAIESRLLRPSQVRKSTVFAPEAEEDLVVDEEITSGDHSSQSGHATDDEESQRSGGTLFRQGTFDESAVFRQHGESPSRPVLYGKVRRAAQISPERRSSSKQRKLSVPRAWDRDLRSLSRLHPDFFVSQEATLQLESRAQPGHSVYAGMRVNDENNYDMLEIYQLEYEPRTAAGKSRGSYRQLALVAGQLMRLSVVRGVTPVLSGYKSGALFKAVCDLKTVNLLIDHYRARTVCTTVLTKAAHLKKIATHARLHFMSTDNSLAAQAERARLHLNTIFNLQKSLSRARAIERKDFTSRIENAAVFMPEDFLECKRRAVTHLNGIMRTHEDNMRNGGAKFADSKLFQKKLLQKWCINFLSFLCLVAGGQRPQVYAQLQVPSVQELEDLRSRANEAGLVELRTLNEKTARSRELPCVILPGSTVQYVLFHINHVRRGILRNAEVDESDCESIPVLLHSETADSLSTSQVTRTFKKFLRRYDPGLGDMTMMDLRASHATMMMKAHRAKKIFADLSETQFLDQLGKQMNTSSEQLRATYLAVDRDDYETSARRLIAAFAEATGSFNDGETDYEVGESVQIASFFA